MPWLETIPVEERERFIDDHHLGLYDMTELCARYAVSRKTGYKWLARDDAGGRPALRDRSRAPHTCPHKIAEPVAQLLLTARRQHPDWGPEKLLQWLEPRHPGIRTWPAISTGGDLLARRGLVKKRRRRGPSQHPGGGVAPHHRAQRPVGRRLQRAVPHRRSDLLLPVDRHRPAHAILTRL